MLLKFMPLISRYYSHYYGALFLCGSLLLMSGCRSLPSPAHALPSATQTQAQINAQSAPASVATHQAAHWEVSNTTEITANSAPPDTSVALFYNELTSDSLLAYADHLRTLNAPELATEIKQIEAQIQVPMPAQLRHLRQKNLQYALVLMQTHSTANLKKAHQLLLAFVAQSKPETEPLNPLAHLLIDSIASQLQLQEALDQQTQQLRENQRRLDAQAERLKAIRAIERSLTLPKAHKPDSTSH